MREPDWKSDDGSASLYLGEALEVLPGIPDASIDAVIADPPYSSGGFTRGDRTDDPARKYVSTGTEIIRASFAGDNRDGRSWCYWCALWLSEARRCVRPSGKCLVFSDWRQLPLASDAIQAGGFVWRGIISWDKGPSARAPHTGYHRHQCEYLVFGTAGVSEADAHGGPWPGCYHHPVLQRDKHHMTGKPTALMEDLVSTIRPGGLILDPFAGSGTTGVACLRTGRRFIGCEIDRANFDVAVRRLSAEASRFPLIRDADQQLDLLTEPLKP
jgi:site-specific DNA-methyltransferase (adenine-specific)